MRITMSAIRVHRAKKLQNCFTSTWLSMQKWDVLVKWSAYRVWQFHANFRTIRDHIYCTNAWKHQRRWYPSRVTHQSPYNSGHSASIPSKYFKQRIERPLSTRKNLYHFCWCSWKLYFSGKGPPNSSSFLVKCTAFQSFLSRKRCIRYHLKAASNLITEDQHQAITQPNLLDSSQKYIYASKVLPREKVSAENDIANITSAENKSCTLTLLQSHAVASTFFVLEDIHNENMSTVGACPLKGPCRRSKFSNAEEFVMVREYAARKNLLIRTTRLGNS